MAKEWIKYAPEGKDTKYHHKMHLRNMAKMQSMMCPKTPIAMTQMSNSKDDNYVLLVNDEEVQIRASEEGQKNNAEPGIFFFAEPEKKSKIEEILLMEIFR